LLQAKIQESQKRMYYEKGYWTEKTMLDYWQDTVSQYPNREYITDGRGYRFTYGEIDDMSSRLASFLRETGVGQGDIVACQVPVWAEFAVLAMACLKVGAVLNPISVTYEQRDLLYFLNLHQPVLFVCPTWFRNHEFESGAVSLLGDMPFLKQVLLLDHNKPKTSDCPTMQEALDQYPPLEQWAKTSADDVAILLCTSGSTGVSKGAMLTHNNIIFSERQFNLELGLTKDDVMFMPSPLNHATGFQHGIIATMMMGARVVLQQKFIVSEAVDLMNREQCTYSMGATTFIYDILKELEETGKELKYLRFYLCGGAPVPGSMVQRAWEYGILLCEVYGSTESTPHLYVPPSETLRLNGTVSGRPVEGVEVRVIDADGNDVGIGEEGEEISRGPNVFVGYTTGMNATNCAIDEDGWFHSGDLCVKNQEGFFRITGRLKDIIIRGGENLNANQLDENLEGCPQIAEHTVIGMPDPRMGERICAYVALKEGVESFCLEDLLEYLKARQIPKWQWPERVEIIDALPRTDSGKIKKYVLRKDIAKRMGLSEPQGAIAAIG
jgi:acyl-CoA synthetase